MSFELNFRIFDQMQSIFMVTVFCHRLFQSRYCLWFTLCTDKSFGNFFIACTYHLYFDKISKKCILNQYISIWIMTVVGLYGVKVENLNIFTFQWTNSRDSVKSCKTIYCKFIKWTFLEFKNNFQGKILTLSTLKRLYFLSMK